LLLRVYRSRRGATEPSFVSLGREPQTKPDPDRLPLSASPKGDRGAAYRNGDAQRPFERRLAWRIRFSIYPASPAARPKPIREGCGIGKGENVMNAKYSLLLAAFLAFFTLDVVDAQQPAKIPTLGYLSQYSGAAGPKHPNLQAFLRGLTELGYVEGKNIAIEYRYTEWPSDRVPALITELVSQKVDIIVVESGLAAVEAKKVTQTIPIVMLFSGDAVASGLVASLDRPGGNVTGLTSISSTGAAKRLQLLAELVPNLTQVGVLWRGPVNEATELEWARTKEAAGPLNVQLHSFVVSDPAGLPAALAEAKRQQVQAIVQFDVAFLAVGPTTAQTIEFTLTNRLPVMYQGQTVMRQGGLISYGVDGLEQSRRAAGYVDRILKGAKAGDLPVGTPEKFVLLVNLKTAKAIGLTIPPSILSKADTVIE
jgi:putative ABC transport system substrate-binding protein